MTNNYRYPRLLHHQTFKRIIQFYQIKKTNTNQHDKCETQL